MHLLRPHFALGIARELRDGLKVAFHFGLRCELPAGETLHCIVNDRCERLIAHDDLAPVLGLLEPVADGNKERVIAALDSGLHFLQGLAAILFPFKLTLRSDDGFSELAFRSIFKSEVETFGSCSVFGQHGAKADMELRIPCKALQIVKDDDVICFLVLSKILKQGRHTGALHEIAPGTLHIAEHFFNDIPPRSGVFAAAMLLRATPVAVYVLPDAGDARVQQRLDFFLCF